MIATPFDQSDADSGPQEIVEDTFRQRVAAMADTLAPAARRVVQFIDQNRLSVLASSAAQLAASIGTSDATVVRTVQALGFDRTRRSAPNIDVHNGCTLDAGG